MTIFNSRRLLYLGVVVFLFCMINGCKKSFQEGTPKASQVAMTEHGAVTIDMQEIYAALPRTVMHNVADQFKAYMGEVQWRYESEYLIVRIPLNHEQNQSFLYAVRPYNNLTGLPHVYLVQYFPESGTIDKNFTGRQMWINFQDWKAYGVKYENGQAFDSLIPVKLAEPSWESCAYDNGAFSLDANGKIIIDEPETSTEGALARFNPLGCWGEGNFWESVGGFFKGIGNAVRDIADGVGGLLSNLGNDTGGSGDSWGGGRYGGVDSWGPGYGTGGWGIYDTGGGSGSEPGPPPPPPVINVIDREDSGLWASLGDNNPLRFNGNNIEGVGSVFVVENAAVTYVRSVLGLSIAQTNWLSTQLEQASKIRAFLLTFQPNLTLQQKEEIALRHIQMMMTDPGYLDFVNNYDVNYPTNPPLLDLVNRNFVPQSANKPIYNTYDYFKCFSNVPDATYKVSLAVQQPQPNTRKAFVPFQNGACDVGHAFLIMEQNVSGVKTTRSIGWYPAMECSPFFRNVPGVINNDEGHIYHVALVQNVSGNDFMNIINEIKTDTHTNYDLSDYNCSNWAYRMIFLHPMDNISATTGYWPFGHGMNPGDLGQDIRAANLESYQSRITTTSNAPMNQGTCP